MEIKKIAEFHERIMKIIKNLKILQENHEDHENFNIICANHDNH